MCCGGAKDCADREALYYQPADVAHPGPDFVEITGFGDLRAGDRVFVAKADWSHRSRKGSRCRPGRRKSAS